MKLLVIAWLENLPDSLGRYRPLFILLPQLTITATFISLIIILLFIAPSEVYITTPFLFLLVLYWTAKIRVWRNNQ